MFIKWATLEVSDIGNIPNGMKLLKLQSGLYAKFNYKGLAKDFGHLMSYIYTNWLPNSEFELDHRPHFNILGSKYKNNHPESEETVYIPIKRPVKD